MYDGRAQMSPIPQPQAWLLAAIAVLACLTLGLSTASADEPEGGGGENPPTEEAPTEPPTESEPPPGETTPSEPETTPSESPGSTTESPHQTESPGEAASPGAAAPSGPGPQTPSGSSAPSGSTSTPARHHSSTRSHPQPQPTGGGTGKGIKVTNPLKSIGSGVDSIISGALAPRQIDKVGQLLADTGLAPRGNKRAQHRAARKITSALGAALLGSAVGLSPPKPAAAPQPIPFVPIHGGPKYLYIALLVLLLAGVGVVLFHQLRPVIRSRQPRPPLISGLDASPAPSPGAGPGRVSVPREPARAAERPSPARRGTR